MNDVCKYDYSFVVPAFNEESHLDFTLKALQKCIEGAQGYSGEIVVVDNNSDDRTAEIARTRGAESYSKRIIKFQRREIGGEPKQRRESFFVDADTIVSTDLFLEALNLIKGGGCGGGALLSFDCKHGGWFWGRLVPLLWNRISGILRLAAGSFLFCRRDFFNECGGFSEKVYAGEEIFFLEAKETVQKRVHELRHLKGQSGHHFVAEAELVFQLANPLLDACRIMRALCYS